jgi:GPH family glycoside/pentoside/hexuronide:cation symporter
MDKSTVSVFHENIPLKKKIAFGTIGAGVGMLSEIALGSALTFFYNIKLGLNEDLVAIAWLIFGIWNAINDPLFGIFEERTKTKIGRRIPYIRYGAPLFALTFIFCWFPIFTSSETALFWNLLLALFLFDSTYTMIGLITYTLPAEMCITQEARSSFSLYSIIFGALGMIVAMMLPLILLTSGESSTDLNPLFQPAMIIVAIFACGIMVWGSFYITENQYAMHEPTLGFVQSITATFKNKAFLIFEANNIFYTIGWTILIGTLTYYVQFILGLSGGMASVPLFAIFLMLFIFIGPANKLVVKYGLKKMYIVGLLITVVGFLLLFFAGSNIVLSFICLCLIGIGFSPITLTGSPLMQDIIDYDEILTGKRRETTYAGVNALLTKPSISIANAMFLMIIKAYDFDKTQTVQSSSAQTGILLAFCFIPAVTLLLAAFFSYFYPLDGEKWQKQKMALNEVHQQKEIAFLKKMKEENPDEFSN